MTALVDVIGAVKSWKLPPESNAAFPNSVKLYHFRVMYMHIFCQLALYSYSHDTDPGRLTFVLEAIAPTLALSTRRLL